MEKSFDRKLAEIKADPNSKAFILVDAKDPDLAWGISSTGEKRVAGASTQAFKSKQEFYEDIRLLVNQAKLDVMLASISTMDVLARQEALFQSSPVTPAVRYNDTSDIWLARFLLHQPGLQTFRQLELAPGRLRHDTTRPRTTPPR